MLDASAAPDSGIFVPESRIGFWFLGTETWATRVIRVALKDLDRLIPEGHRPRRPLVLDAGCGQGKSFLPLFEQFSPSRIIGIDFDEHCVAAARVAAGALPVDVRRGELSRIDLADRSVDLVFCHQTFHHLTRQQLALGEFYRVLKLADCCSLPNQRAPTSIRGLFACCFATRWMCSAVPASTDR